MIKGATRCDLHGQTNLLAGNTDYTNMVTLLKAQGDSIHSSAVIARWSESPAS
jgi:hypothetical protein